MTYKEMFLHSHKTITELFSGSYDKEKFPVLRSHGK